MASVQSRFDLPGFSLPLNFTPGPGRRVMFPNGLDDDNSSISRLDTHREIVMMRAMNSITDKSDWDKKVFNDEIIARWRKEIRDSGEDVSERMLEWIIKEAQWKAEVLRDTKHVVAFDVGVVKSDVTIPEELRQALIDAVHPLEEILKEQKDYHPGTDNKVVDLVHPSLFPVIYGQTRILPDQLISLEAFADHIGEGKVLPVRPKEESVTWQSDYEYRVWRPPHRPYSLKFQWLPCDVHFESSDEDECRIVSYINNLHPERHRALYQVIEKILTRTIPLWNKTLSLLQDEYKRIEYYEVEFEDHPEPYPDAANVDAEKTELERRYENTEWERLMEWQLRQPIKLPEPRSFTPHTFKSQVNLRQEYAERGLQVIVKLANIELTPEKPDYEGGSWHIEGQLNEHICATAIYYYDSKNITESTLAFRHQASKSKVRDINYENNRHGFLQQVFGFGPDVNGLDEFNLTQLLGSVETRQGRLLTFPNILQHCVAPFSLADTSNPGHRKILAFFLVDPHLSIISSANVPPQQEDWWRERQELVGRLLGENKLPPELQNMVNREFGVSPITMEEAKQYRKELMEERSSKLKAQNNRFELNYFNLCQH